VICWPHLQVSDATFILTAYSYACPQTFPDRISDGGPFPGEVYPPASDEFKCLILQLNVPLACLESTPHYSKLPVLVYIHGGGFVLGRIDDQHSTALMADQAFVNSQPIITANIQYRLGALGYLHTTGNTNLALNDQRNALLWIQKFAEGFGGDRTRVTVFGESAGSMSICAHMLSSPPISGPLFQRAVLMSGSLGPMTAPILAQEAKQMYDKFVLKCDVQAQGQAGLEELREMDLQKIVDVTAEFNDSGAMWLTVQAEGWFGSEAGPVTWDRVPELIGKCEWVEEIVLGTTGFEVSLYNNCYQQVLEAHAYITGHHVHG
jgi:carboxylesterase type B